MESLKSAFCLIEFAMPKEDPIKKQALLFPDNFIELIFCASSSEESSFPSGVNMQNHAFFGIFSVIIPASFSNAAEISTAEGASDVRASGNSKIVNLQYPFNRLLYSSAADK